MKIKDKKWPAMQCCFNETEPEASQIRLTKKKSQSASPDSLTPAGTSRSARLSEAADLEEETRPPAGSCLDCFSLVLEHVVGHGRTGKRIGPKLGPFALLVPVALRRVRAPWGGNQAWTGGRLALFLMGSSNRLIGRAANAGVVGEKVGWCRLPEASGRLAA